MLIQGLRGPKRNPSEQAFSNVSDFQFVYSGTDPSVWDNLDPSQEGIERLTISPSKVTQNSQVIASKDLKEKVFAVLKCEPKLSNTLFKYIEEEMQFLQEPSWDCEQVQRFLWLFLDHLRLHQDQIPGLKVPIIAEETLPKVYKEALCQRVMRDYAEDHAIDFIFYFKIKRLEAGKGGFFQTRKGRDSEIAKVLKPKRDTQAEFLEKSRQSLQNKAPVDRTAHYNDQGIFPEPGQTMIQAVINMIVQLVRSIRRSSLEDNHEATEKSAFLQRAITTASHRA